jgi:hypothetical protein
MGVETGFDLTRLGKVVACFEQLLGRPLGKPLFRKMWQP